MKLSIVATLYHSEPHLEEFCQRTAAIAEQLVGHEYEIILVNDGSPDLSLNLALQIRKKIPNITIVDLSRNFGHHKAMMTGLAHAVGDKVFLIDSDLEEAPEWLITFAKQMANDHSDVVYGVQEKRKGKFFERYSGYVFYKFLNCLIQEKLPENITVARLMSRRYVNALLLHQERELYIAGLWHITGFAQTPILVKKQCSSQSTYTFRRKISLLVNSITSFSNLPLTGIFYFGLVVMLFACGYTSLIIIQKFIFHSILTGWTSLMASVWLLGGLIISFIGIIGIYLSKIFIEIKQRPYTIVREIYGKNTCSGVKDSAQHNYTEATTE